MAHSRKSRSDQEWMELITESRRSGLSDADWCRRNSIPTSSFYNAVVRLRKKACEIPASSNGVSGRIVDLTAGAPDVVPIRIEPETQPAAAAMLTDHRATWHLDNSHSIEILIGEACVRVSNGTDPALLSAAITSLGRALC